MFKAIKYLMTGLVLGLLVGLWFGYNTGKGRTFYANPFTEPELRERIGDTAEEAVEESKRGLREALR